MSSSKTIYSDPLPVTGKPASWWVSSPKTQPEIFLKAAKLETFYAKIMCICMKGLEQRRIQHRIWTKVNRVQALKVKVTQSCLILWDPMDYIVHGILQARILKWVAYPFSSDLPNSGIELGSPALQVDSLPTELWGKFFIGYKVFQKISVRSIRKNIKNLSQSLVLKT